MSFKKKKKEREENLKQGTLDNLLDFARTCDLSMKFENLGRIPQ